MFKVDIESALQVEQVADMFQDAENILIDGVRTAFSNLDTALALGDLEEQAVEVHSIVLFAGAAYELSALRRSEVTDNEFGWVKVAREVCDAHESESRKKRLARLALLHDADIIKQVTKRTYGVCTYTTKKSRGIDLPEPFLVASGVLAIDPDLARRGLS